MRIAVIGGGIIGLSSAYFLANDGWEVTLFEKGDLSDNCSFGNMGYLSPSHFAPLAAPGMVKQGMLWMLNSKSPFYVRPQPSARLARWGWRFFRSATESHVRNSSKPLAELLLYSKSIVADWARTMAMEYTENGCMMLYRTAKKEKEELENAETAERLGLKAEICSRARTHALEPELKPDVLGGVWYRDDAHVYPNQLMQQLIDLLPQMGVQLRTGSPVTGFEKQNGRIAAVLSQGQRFETDFAVLAAGSWSPEVAKMAGDDLDLMPGKGYSMTIPVSQQKLKHPCILLEAKVAITPYAHRLRIGSTMEIGPINNRILWPRVEGILAAVPDFLPGYAEDPAFQELSEAVRIKKDPGRVWYGFRPVSPDGMPYIGYSGQCPNLIWATGHAMLGLSLGPGTGKVVADLASGKKPAVDATPYRTSRF